LTRRRGVSKLGRVIAARRLAPLVVAAVAALLAAGAASPAAPRDVTQRPASIPLSFKLPFYWERQKTPRGYAFYSRADDLTASLAVAELPGKIRNGSDLANAAADVVAATYGRIDPNATLQVSRVVLPIGASLRTVVHFHQTVNGLPGEGVAILYFVSHGGHGYAFFFHTGPGAVQSWEPIFTRTAKSIRFTGTSL
jgi:hypothetical protein